MQKYANPDRLLIFRIALVFIASFACLAAVAEGPPPIDADGYELTWSEEFNQDGRLDPSIWVYEKGFRRNYEDQWYQSENAWCANGRLVIEARRVSRPNPDYQPGSENWRHKRRLINYTSASVKTRDKKQWLYGRLEVRAKIDVGPGLWPAIWTLGSARKWPACGEVDLMEYYDDSLLANAAWCSGEEFDPIWDTAKVPLKDIIKNETIEEWASRFHTWRMDWSKESIKLYVDDRLMNEVDLSETINRSEDGANPFHEPHYLLLNLAIGGTQGGDPSKTDFPKRMEVDYVRLYQRKEMKDAKP